MLVVFFGFIFKIWFSRMTAILRQTYDRRKHLCILDHIELKWSNTYYIQKLYSPYRYILFGRWIRILLLNWSSL